MISSYLKDKRQVSLAEAKEVVDHGGSVIWRPYPSLPEEEQYAIVVCEPNIKD